MKGIIYKHTCPNGKSYIGQTYKKPELRWGKNGKGYQRLKYFYNAIQKYGWENISHDILDEIEFNGIKQLNELEEYYILKYNTLYPNGYNLQTQGANCVRTPEFGKTISEGLTPEVLKNRSAVFKSRGCNKGVKNGMYGKPAHNRGIPMSEKQREALRKANDGRKSTPISREKCSKSISALVWINNGKINHRIKKDAELPEGFKYGRFLNEDTLEKFRSNGKKHFSGKNNPFYGKSCKGSDSPSYKKVDKEIIDDICNNFTYIKDGLAYYNITLYVFNQRYKEYYGIKFKDRNKKLKYLGFKEEKDADEFKEE